MTCISVIVPTKDRPRTLASLLSSILEQDRTPDETIVVDDSVSGETKQLVENLREKFRARQSSIIYVTGRKEGLPAARNLGINLSRGQILIFLDDDIIMARNVISILSTFLMNNIQAKGASPRVKNIASSSTPHRSLVNAFRKAFGLDYLVPNKLGATQVGTSIFPSIVTTRITAARLFGCCFAFRRDVFKSRGFDTKMKGYAYGEDFEFSYWVNLTYPMSLFVLPEAVVWHKEAPEVGIDAKRQTESYLFYKTYIFFKHFYMGRLRYLILFLYSLAGQLILLSFEGLVKQPRQPQKLFFAFQAFTKLLWRFPNVIKGEIP